MNVYMLLFSLTEDEDFGILLEALEGITLMLLICDDNFFAEWADNKFVIRCIALHVKHAEYTIRHHWDAPCLHGPQCV